MDHADIVISLDKKYHWTSPDAVKCPNDGKTAKLPQSGVTHTDHGFMGVHKSGQVLVCGVCDTKYPTSGVN